MSQPNPIFIIGSYRSGTSVLTWCLGQHSGILPLEETNWIYKCALVLREIYQYGIQNGKHAHLNSVSEELIGFYASFGKNISTYIMDHKLETIEHAERLIGEYGLDPTNYSLLRSDKECKTRWIDGTPENSHYVYGLQQLFPEAKFIHILRHPVKVANSLMKFSTMGQRDYEEEEAYLTWTRLTRAAYLAEQAFGSHKILRVRQEDLELDPEQVIETCLSFVGEPFEPDCLLPLNSRINSSGTHGLIIDMRPEQAEKPYVRDALSLYDEMMNNPPGTPKENASESLAADFIAKAEYTSTNHVEGLANWGHQLSQELTKKNTELLELRRKVQQRYEILRLVSYGPMDITRGQAFNVQADGRSAIWVRTENATSSTVLVFNEVELVSDVHEQDNLVTAIVPAELYGQSGNYQLYLRDTETGVVSPPVFVKVKDDPS